MMTKVKEMGVVRACVLDLLLRYDMVYLRAVKSWCYGQLNLADSIEMKHKEKLKTIN